ncbi:MAG TPA: transporter [Polyangiaceae bacterium]|nr:transporter [Polyangiaceae bacterium]
MSAPSLWLSPFLFAAAAGVDAPSQATFHSFSPTPRDAMREMVTDRPDTTESPFTVDPGHVQLEMDAFAAERDDGATELWVAASNLRLGLTSSLDLHLIVEPWRHADGISGFGDLTLRAKLNLWGNDGGATAFGVIPFVRFPTAAPGLGAGDVEGGLILPLTLELPSDFELGTMLELDETHRDDGYGTDLVVSGSLGHDLWGELGGYVELATSVPLDGPDDTELGVNGGLILQLGDDVAIDTGTRFGLTAPAPDFAWFVGGSARY